MNSYQYGAPLSSEILPGLWQGGTHDSDTVGGFGFGEYQPTKDNFDTVITLYGHANPAGRNVKELRLSIIDGYMSDFDANEDLSIENLTKGNKTMKQKFEQLPEGEND